VNTFKVSTSGGLVTFTTEIFGIPLMKHSWYVLKHCLVDVKGEKRACYATKEAAVFAACIRGILEYPYKCGKTRNGVPTWVDHNSPTPPTERSPKELLLSVYTQIQNCSFGKVGDRPIICRHCIIPWWRPYFECLQRRVASPTLKNLTYPPCTKWAKSNQQSQQ
jgi:hypothetical protein